MLVRFLALEIEIHMTISLAVEKCILSENSGGSIICRMITNGCFGICFDVCR